MRSAVQPLGTANNLTWHPPEFSFAALTLCCFCSYCSFSLSCSHVMTNPSRAQNACNSPMGQQNCVKADILLPLSPKHTNMFPMTPHLWCCLTPEYHYPQLSTVRIGFFSDLMENRKKNVGALHRLSCLGKILQGFYPIKTPGSGVIFRANLSIMAGFQDKSSAAGAVWFSWLRSEQINRPL